MCYTVAIMRKGVLVAVDEYYNSLPASIRNKTNKPSVPLFQDMFLKSGFSHPVMPVLSSQGFSLKHWGLIPSWIKSKGDVSVIQRNNLNARGETIFTKPSFAQAIQQGRCLLPVSAFYEWRLFQGIKYPYLIQPAYASCFWLGAISDCWDNDPAAGPIDSFSIITTPANAMMEIIHNRKKRMPLILKPTDCIRWLDGSLSQQDVGNLIKPYGVEEMKAYTVSRRINRMSSEFDAEGSMQACFYSELESPALF